MNDQLAVEIANLSYAYRSDWLFKRIDSLHDINLSVIAGEAFGFLGHNGAGKTTTIKCLLNLIRPKTGSVKLFGGDSTDPKARYRVGYLPEQPYFYDHLTVYETLEMYAALAGVESNLRRTKCLKTLERVGLEQRLNARMRTLSKGLTQRLALAQAIVANPQLLILDEPFSGLDPLGRREFSEIFSQLRKEGVTLFMSSHILSDVQALCDRFSILVKGHMKGVYSMQQIADLIPGQYELVIQLPAQQLELLPLADSTQQGDRLLILHYNNQEVAKQALSVAIANNISINSYQFTHGGLEELFIKLVKDSTSESISA